MQIYSLAQFVWIMHFLQVIKIYSFILVIDYYFFYSNTTCMHNYLSHFSSILYCLYFWLHVIIYWLFFVMNFIWVGSTSNNTFIFLWWITVFHIEITIFVCFHVDNNNKTSKLTYVSINTLCSVRWCNIWLNPVKTYPNTVYYDILKFYLLVILDFWEISQKLI